jgi:inosine-uridine nucleoside N-ribohydrolase
MTTRIPIVLDTDIGTDVDDTWALAFLLRCPELDLKYVNASTDNTAYRARLVARTLEIAGRTDIPVGLGVSSKPDDWQDFQAPYVEGYALDDYPGTIVHDGEAGLIDVVMSSDEPVTVLAIGPLTSVAEALRREPEIARRAKRFVGMHGSFKYKEMRQPGPVAEYNVVRDAPAAQAVFSAAWDKTITPLDTCGCVVLEGAHMASLRASTDPLVKAVIQSHDLYCTKLKDLRPDRSSILYDTVGVYLTFASALLQLEDIAFTVSDDGFTRPDPDGATVHVATEWRDMNAFKDLLVARLHAAD